MVRIKTTKTGLALLISLALMFLIIYQRGVTFSVIIEEDEYFGNETFLVTPRSGKETPCKFIYTDYVDLRIIVLAFNRIGALVTLLHSLEQLQLDGAVASLEIWIDRDKNTGKVNRDIWRLASNYTWSLGSTRVYVWKWHVGIYGQWIDTWCPRENVNELALILEEDIIVSPYSWRWINAVHQKFGSCDHVAGYTLQSELVASCVTGKALSTNSNHTAFAYRLLGTWGFVPHPRRWSEFQTWFYRMQTVKGAAFKPYVNGITMTKWYKTFEKLKQQDTMWSMWFIYFANKQGIYTVYNNINRLMGNDTYCLSVHNSAFGGMHYHPIRRQEIQQAQQKMKQRLLKTWLENYGTFSPDIQKFEFNGKSSLFLNASAANLCATLPLSTIS